MSISQILQKAILATALVAITAMAQTPYDDGQKALREREWTRAAEYFDKAIEADEQRADASMYWRAYALYESRRDREAERQLRTLERKYPKSRWLKEAQVLKIEHGGSVAGDDQGALEDEELRMFALARLMERDPARALPLVLELLQETTSDDVRRDTLFMLGMSDAETAQKAIAQIAKDSKNPALQAEAIQMLGFSDNESAHELLKGMYTADAHDMVKGAVLKAYMVGDDPTPLVDIFHGEQDPRWQKDILHVLGVMDATAELQTLYPTLQSKEVKLAALKSVFITGDTTMLKQVLDTETDTELRKTAIQGIAMQDDAASAAYLESVYDQAQSVDEKRVVIESLAMMDQAEDLALKIVRAETDTQLRIQAIQMLGVMDAGSALVDIYADIDEPELRRAVLEGLMIAGDTAGLIKVHQAEQDSEMRWVAIEMLAVAGDEQAAQYLVNLYPNATREEKEKTIEAMMIMDDAKGLVGLLKTETDPDLKRNMMQMLTLMDSDEAEQYLFELLEKK